MAAKALKRPDHIERVALVLQGGGALGAYQAGAYASLAGTDWEPDWVSGISIGAINAAIIAGNPPETRIAKLRQFWELITSQNIVHAVWPGGPLREAFDRWSAGLSASFGLPGFFRPQSSFNWLSGAMGPSVYDTRPLLDTLNEIVDFDYLHSGSVRLSVGAVDVEAGNSVVFDSSDRRLGPEHVMASGALPPGFPPIRIGKRSYWDGGIVSNTPLQYVLDQQPRPSTLCFQVDLFNQKGPIPETLDDVYNRQKDIVYSSRTRFNTDQFREKHDMRHAIHDFLMDVPDEIRDAPQLERLWAYACPTSMTIVHLIYRDREGELESKDYEFSRQSMEEHWRNGEADMNRALKHQKAWLQPPGRETGVRVMDFGHNRRSS